MIRPLDYDNKHVYFLSQRTLHAYRHIERFNIFDNAKSSYFQLIGSTLEYWPFFPGA